MKRQSIRLQGPTIRPFSSHNNVAEKKLLPNIGIYPFIYGTHWETVKKKAENSQRASILQTRIV